LSQLKDNREKYIAKWVAPGKIVGLVVNRNQDYPIGPNQAVIIIRPKE
jgi:hypothetical protein